MAKGGNALSRNPNLCASCSSILDGMESCPDGASYPGDANPEQVETQESINEPHLLPVEQAEEVHHLG